MLDLSAPEYDKARRMLETDIIAWFTTVDADGAPHAVPVWFFLHEGQVIVSSEPQTVKVQHVKAGSPVLLHLHAGGPHGDDVVILSGTAEAHDGEAGAWLAKYADAYAAKYAEALEAFGMPADAVTEKYSTALVFTPEGILTW